MSTTVNYWSTTEGQALQWSLIAIGALLICVGVTILTAYFCYKSGVRSIKPKIFAGRPVFYVPPRRVHQMPGGGVGGQGQDIGGGQVLNENGEPVPLPLKIPLPVKQPQVHIHHHGDETESVSKKSDNEDDQNTDTLALPPGYGNMSGLPPHSFFHQNNGDHPFGIGPAHNYFIPQGNVPGMFGLPGFNFGLAGHNAAITGLGNGMMNRAQAVLQSEDDESGEEDGEDELPKKQTVARSNSLRKSARSSIGNDLRRIASDGAFNEQILVNGNNVILSSSQNGRNFRKTRRK